MLLRMPVDITWPYGGGSPGASIFHLRASDGEALELVLGNLSEIVRQFYAAMDDLYVANVRIKFAGLFTGVGPDQGEAVEIDPWEVSGTAGVGPLPPLQPNRGGLEDRQRHSVRPGPNLRRTAAVRSRR